MKNAKILMAMMLSFFSTPLYAQNENLEFHLDCFELASDCVEVPFQDGLEKTIKIKKDAEMVIQPSDIEESAVQTDQYGKDELAMSFRSEAKEKFAKVTKENNRRRLVVLMGGKVVVAPIIQTPIPDGRLVITVGTRNGIKFLDNVPWLKSRSEDKRANNHFWSLTAIITYVVLGVGLIVGSIYFAFLRKEKND